MKFMSTVNGPEPEQGSWVIASESNDPFGCPDREPWQHVGRQWVDLHGCSRRWQDLGDPIDCPNPSEWRDA